MSVGLLQILSVSTLIQIYFVLLADICKFRNLALYNQTTKDYLDFYYMSTVILLKYIVWFMILMLLFISIYAEVAEDFIFC